MDCNKVLISLVVAERKGLSIASGVFCELIKGFCHTSKGSQWISRIRWYHMPDLSGQMTKVAD
jgi:hypothetical protein